MALKQLRTAETVYVSDTIADDITAPPTTDAVYDAIGGVDIPTDAHIADVAKATVFTKILMSANEKTYEVTIDAEGKLAVEEQTEGD